MKCPKCINSVALKPRKLEESLVSHSCDTCEGIFISSDDYISWQQRQVNKEDEKVDVTGEFEYDDTLNAILCPECMRIMLKYDVRSNIPFRLDFCRSCNGVWLDKNEWETLKERNLHDDINFVFTHYWQRILAEEKTEEKMLELFIRRVGEADYMRVRDFKEWLCIRKDRSEILAFLSESENE